MWPEPGREEPVEKLSYAKIFKPWDGIIGTGIHIDDVRAVPAAEEADVAESLSGQMNSGAEQTSGKANGVAAAEEMNAKMASVATANISMIASAAEELAGLAKIMNQLVGRFKV